MKILEILRDEETKTNEKIKALREFAGDVRKATGYKCEVDAKRAAFIENDDLISIAATTIKSAFASAVETEGAEKHTFEAKVVESGLLELISSEDSSEVVGY